MPRSDDTSNSKRPSPKGRVLATSFSLDGHSTVELDNGPYLRARILCRTETLADLLAIQGSEIIDHITTRKPGHFRGKRSAA